MIQKELLALRGLPAHAEHGRVLHGGGRIRTCEG